MARFRVVLYLTALLLVQSTDAFGQDNQALVTAGSEAAQARVFNIKYHGAVGHGVAMDTDAIQKTMDACHAVGGGIVRVPAGDFQIGTSRLKSTRRPVPTRLREEH